MKLIFIYRAQASKKDNDFDFDFGGSGNDNKAKKDDAFDFDSFGQDVQKPADTKFDPFADSEPQASSGTGLEGIVFDSQVCFFLILSYKFSSLLLHLKKTIFLQQISLNQPLLLLLLQHLLLRTLSMHSLPNLLLMLQLRVQIHLLLLQLSHQQPHLLQLILSLLPPASLLEEALELQAQASESQLALEQQESV